MYVCCTVLRLDARRRWWCGRGEGDADDLNVALMPRALAMPGLRGAVRLARETRLVLFSFFLCARLGGARRSGHQRRAGDDQAERGEAQDAFAGVVAQALTEDEDAAGDRGQVRGDGRGSDHR